MRSLRRRVHDALSLVVDGATVHIRIIEQAIAAAGPDFDPSHPGQFALFVGGPLHQTVSHVLGVAAADRIQATLDPLLSERAIEESGVHRVDGAQYTAGYTASPDAVAADVDDDEPEMPVFEEDTFVSSTMKRLTYEALDMVASPSIRNDMLSEALDRANLYDLPVETDELAAWVNGPLLQVVGEVLGGDVAEALAAQLQPVLASAAKDDGYDCWEDDSEQTPPSRRGVKGARTSVVIVDDDPAVLASLERQLGQRGYDVRIEHEAHMAVMLCTDRLPDVVIAASELPDASAVELGSLLRLTFGDEAPALIVLTRNGRSSEAAVARTLRKPIDLDELCAVIDELRDSSARQSLA